MQRQLAVILLDTLDALIGTAFTIPSLEQFLKWEMQDSLRM